MINELWMVLKESWMFLLIYTACFLFSVDYIRSYYDGKTMEREKEISEKTSALITEYNELVGRYNHIVKEYDKLYDCYSRAYNNAIHTLYLGTKFKINSKVVLTFAQVFYPKTGDMICLMSRLNLKTGNIRKFQIG